MGTLGPEGPLLAHLVQREGGLFSKLQTILPSSDEMRVCVKLTSTGPSDRFTKDRGRFNFRTRAEGTGTGIVESDAMVPALAEGLERYCATCFKDQWFIRARAEDLGELAVDLDKIPRCSPLELGHTRCPLTPPSKTKPIRWVRGLKLDDGSVRYLPAIMAFSGAMKIESNEKFWIPSSSGCAAHVSYASALLRAIYELIERDAIGITWLQRTPHPEINLETIWPHIQKYENLYTRSSCDIEYRLFDATNDLGVPVVYGLQISPRHPSVRTLLACSTGLSIPEAVTKVLRDFAALRLAFRRPVSLPKSFDDFTDILHGAAYMAHPERANAFDFLFQKEKKLDYPIIHLPLTEPVALGSVLRRLQLLKLDSYVVDLSSDEALRVGMRVLRVIIPGLFPLSFRYRARFLGHPRLYTAPKLWGYRSSEEIELNTWPQPFA